MSETLSQNPDSSPNTATDWSVLEGDHDKETDVNQANPETTNEQFKEAVMDVIAAREELFKLSEESRKNPGDDGVRQAAREQSVLVQALIERRNKLAEQKANERPAE
jgi:hypothetical protein